MRSWKVEWREPVGQLAFFLDMTSFLKFERKDLAVLQ